MNDVRKAIEGKILQIMNPDKSLKRPHNRLWMALLAFNLIFLPLDVATGLTVGYITRWYYGLFVFGAGFGTMIVHEALYSNAYASKWQKAISVFGFMTSITVTGLIGVGAIAVNVLYAGYDRELAGVVMAGGSFLTLFLHGMLFAVYYFVDSGILASQRASASMAEHDRQITQFGMASQLVDQFKILEGKLLTAYEKGDGDKMGAALASVTGENWLPAAAPMPKDVRLNSEVKTPVIVDPTARQGQE